MEWKDAQNIYVEAKEQSQGDEDAQLLWDQLLVDAVVYARLRTDWKLADIQNRVAMDERRTQAHDAFISSCDILARYLRTLDRDIGWRQDLGVDRKDIGDFACYIHAILGIAAR